MADGRPGVLLLNTGSPRSPAVEHVRLYIREFLMDPRVMDMPWLLRVLLVKFAIVPIRARLSAEAYARIWTPEGSPLVVYSRRLQQRLETHLGVPVGLAMRYGSPTVECALNRLLGHGISKVVLVPLFPHYAMSSYETTVSYAQQVIATRTARLETTVLPPFYDNPAYIGALVSNAMQELKGGFDHVLFSFHGLPERHIRKTDPTGRICLRQPNCCELDSPATKTCYRAQCLRTMRAFAAAAGLHNGSYSFAFQSRLGPGRWLRPHTFETLTQLGQAKCKRLLVLCPSFLVDCLETLDEIGLRGRQLFQQAGGGEFVLIPSLNDHPAWVDALAGLISSHLP
ncbi:MAG: ferrochelatase [Verrucomicrobiae bacterium]|nr:ferrochelatase [Verrucomicrobiae bacterium]